MENSPTILAISGSVREGSTNARILQYLKGNLDSRCEYILYDGLSRLPHFNQDLDCDPLPDEVALLRRLFDRSSAVIFCSPEYVFSLPGSFKNLLDWQVSTTNMLNKPVAMIVAAADGSRAFQSLETILSTLGATINEKCKLLIGGARGKITSEISPDVRASLDELGNALLESI